MKRHLLALCSLVQFSSCAALLKALPSQLGPTGSAPVSAASRAAPPSHTEKLTVPAEGVVFRYRAVGHWSSDEETVAELDLPQAAINAEFKTRVCSLLAPWEVPRRWVGTKISE